MKISLVCMCVLGFYFSNSTLMQYKCGTIIKQEKVINAGSNKMNLIIQYVNYIQEDLFNVKMIFKKHL